MYKVFASLQPAAWLRAFLSSSWTNSYHPVMLPCIPLVFCFNRISRPTMYRANFMYWQFVLMLFIRTTEPTAGVGRGITISIFWLYGVFLLKMCIRPPCTPFAVPCAAFAVKSCLLTLIPFYEFSVNLVPIVKALWCMLPNKSSCQRKPL